MFKVQTIIIFLILASGAFAQEFKLGMSVSAVKSTLAKQGAIIDTMYLEGTIKPRITFIRAFNSTYYGAMGKVVFLFDKPDKVSSIMWWRDSSDFEDFKYFENLFRSKFGKPSMSSLAEASEDLWMHIWWLKKRQVDISYKSDSTRSVSVNDSYMD